MLLGSEIGLNKTRNFPQTLVRSQLIAVEAAFKLHSMSETTKEILCLSM
jgi:hypothetical protein